MTDAARSPRPDAPLPDAVRGHWLDTLAPRWLRPYGRLARWDRPIGWWLLLLPAWWATALAAVAAGDPYPNPAHLALFLIGAVAMRGAGCTWNDFIDRDYDARVERTRSRPIASGEVSVREAAAFAVLQSLVGLAVLLQFNAYTVLLGMASLLVVALYPFAKRVTMWPQFVLGLAFSWGALVGWSARFGSLDAVALLLYGAAIAWTIGYDTIYAHQDARDDAIVGVKSTARLFGRRTRPIIALFYVLAVVLLGLAFLRAGAGLPAWLGLAAGAAHLAWQVTTLERSDPGNCLARFRANRTTGLLVFLGLVLDTAL